MNEPETSLHPDLLPALGRLIAQAAARSQICVVSHAPRLIATLGAQKACHLIPLEKSFGETTVAGVDDLAGSGWDWPTR